ncbi:MAG TPA: hypothetical protein VHE55_13445 [Fimbriimonadaceae bacterium]|nr:hypothetical protein [Fimbriimonadaceae bacterium]
MQSSYDGPPRRKSGVHWAWIVLGILAICGCGGVGLLGSILFPAFSRARAIAQERRCISNVRVLVAASAMYAEDFDDHLPPASLWMDALKSRADSPGNFSCPSVSRPNAFGPRVAGKYGYAFNEALSGKSRKGFSAQKSEVLIFESLDVSRNAQGDPATSAPPNRHGKGRTQGFTDGHAAFVKSSSSPSGSE